MRVSLSYPSFYDHFSVFNSAAKPSEISDHRPEAIFLPTSSADVAEIVRFAHASKLTLSVKSGGYNPSNWSCSGQIVVDLAELNLLEMSLPADEYNAAAVSSSALDVVDSVDSEQAPVKILRSRGKGATMIGAGEKDKDSTSGKAKGKRVHRPGSPNGVSIHSVEPSLPNGHTFIGAELETLSVTQPDSVLHVSGLHAGSEVDHNKRRRLHDCDNGKRTSRSRSKSPETGGVMHDMPLHAEPETGATNGPSNLSSQIDEKYQRDHTAEVQDTIENSEDAFGSNGVRAGPTTMASRIVVASTYPPQNLTQADLQNHPHIADFAHSRADVGDTDRVIPINYNPRTTTITYPNPAPPGSIPFSPRNMGSSGSTSLSNLGDLNTARHGTPGASISTNTSQTSRSSSASSASSTNVPFGASDPSSYARISFGAGIRAQELDAFSGPFNYFVPTACYPVGTAIFTTGGYGFVSRKYGLSMDLTLELEVVLPKDGRIVILKENFEKDPTLTEEEKKEQEELWWAFRGAGTAFGIVTRIDAKAFRIGSVLSGNIIYPFNAATAPSLLRHWRDCLKASPRELYSNFTLSAGPSASGHVIVIQFSWCGKSQSEGESILQTIMSWQGEQCLMKDVEVRPYAHQQENVSQILSSKENSRWLIRSTLLSSLTDEAAHASVDLFKTVPAGTSWLFETAGGAIAEPSLTSCYPYSHRKSPLQVAALHQWIDPKEDEQNRVAAEGWVYRTFGQDGVGPFPCFLTSAEGKDRMILTYGSDNWARLTQLKQKYDPEGLLRYTHFENELLSQ